MESALYHLVAKSNMDHGKSQFGKPTGIQGREVMERMNMEHLPLTQWGISMLADVSPLSILDVGCGGGIGLRQASIVWKNARLTGVDISEDALAFCSEMHPDLIDEGMELVRAGAEDLPFDDGSFDLVMSFESYFFWDDLRMGMEELGRVLSPGGTMLICSEAYPHPDFRERNEENARKHGLKLLDPDEMVRMLPRELYESSIHLLEDRNWMSVVFRKR